MNISQIFAPLISTFWWLIPLLLIVGAIKAFKPYLKGKMGGVCCRRSCQTLFERPLYIVK